MSLPQGAHKAFFRLAASTLRSNGYKLDELILLPGASRRAFRAVSTANDGTPKIFFIKFSRYEGLSGRLKMLDNIDSRFPGLIGVPKLLLLSPRIEVDDQSLALQVYQWEPGYVWQGKKNLRLFGKMLSQLHEWAQGDRDTYEIGKHLQNSMTVKVNAIELIKKILPENHLRHVIQAFQVCQSLEAVIAHRPHTIVHGDLNLSNILFHGEACTLTDWDECHWSTPEADIAAMAMNFGSKWKYSRDFAEFRAGYESIERRIDIRQVERFIIARHMALISRIVQHEDCYINDYEAAHITGKLLDDLEIHVSAAETSL